MGRLLLGRTMRLLVTVLAVSFVSFLLLYLTPGDPAIDILGPLNVTPENIARVHEELGLDEPFFERYGSWLAATVQGDLGQSYRSREPVLSLIADRLPVTIELTVFSQLIALGLAVTLALVAVRFHRTPVDRISSTTSFILISIPDFVLALGLILIFAVGLGWLPATGYVPVADGLGANLESMLLPALSLAAATSAVYMRVLRTELLTTMRQEYIEFARAKGLSPRYILLRHALRPSSLSLLTLGGITFGVLIGGSFIIESLFALPGVGRLAIESIYRKDFLVVQGVVLLVTIVYVVINFTVDVLYAFLDPRVRTRPAL